MELNDVSVDINKMTEDAEKSKTVNQDENNIGDVNIDTDKKDMDNDADFDDVSKDSEYCCTVTSFLDKHRETCWVILKVLLLMGYFVYFGFAVSYHLGDEGSWRLVGFTILGAWLISWNLLKKTKCHQLYSRFVDGFISQYNTGRRSLIIRWCLYIAMAIFMVIYVIMFVAMKTPSNLRSLIGIFTFPFLLFLYSNNKRKVNWHTIFWCMSLQFVMALLVLKTSWGSSIIEWCGDRLQEFIKNGEAGSEFVFGKTWRDHRFVMGSMVEAFVLIVGLSVISYLGVITFIVETVGSILATMIDVKPVEGINAIGNIFLNIPESIMLVQDYLPEMTPSQLFVTYAGGLSTVSGVALVIFVTSGVQASALVAASAMSAPAALACAKLVFPSTKDEKIPERKDDVSGRRPTAFLRHPTSLLDAIILGINQSLAIVVQVTAFIMTAVIILEFLNNTMVWFGDRIGVDEMTVEFLLSYVFYPFGYMMGARSEDCLFIGELLGIRTFSFAVVAYPKLGTVVQNGLKFREYISEGDNNTWTQVGKDIFLDNRNETLVGGVMEARSEIIATYALCGSASFAILGMIMGSVEVIVPHRSKEVNTHIFRAMIAGTVASYLTACFAGLLHEEGV
ncbi:hypothetical protein ACF0H5_017810 [Mactra antiquata]